MKRKKIENTLAYGPKADKRAEGPQLGTIYISKGSYSHKKEPIL